MNPAATTLPNVLVIDDEAVLREDMQILLAPHFKISSAEDSASGLAKVINESPATVLLDIDLREKSDGIDLLLKIRELPNAPPVIMLTSDKRVETIVRAIRLGAYHYLTKPPNPHEAVEIIGRALQEASLRRKVAALERDLQTIKGDLISCDKAMMPVIDDISKVAGSDATVLITGDSGTGKEVVARRIHHLSRRAQGPFVAINCAAIAPELAESELFGHEMGSYTGATRRHTGVFEQASGGTLLLDEVGDCSLPVQSKLLRVLEERSLRRVGGMADIQVDVRLLAATSRDVEQQVKDGTLRPELFYRLNVFRIHIPPLRERPDDIQVLADHYCSVFARDMGKNLKGLTPGAREVLRQRQWAGNVRVLKNAVERAVILCTGSELDVEHFAPDARLLKGQIAPYRKAKEEVVQRFQREYLTQCLSACKGNVSRAAAMSDMPRQNFQRLLRDVGIDPAALRS